MINHQPTILGLSPGARYFGFAILRGQDLRDWGIRVIKKKSPEEKVDLGKQILSSLADQHQVNILAIKNFHPSRSSTQLNQLTAALIALARSKGMQICRYPLERVKAAVCGTEKVSKEKLAGHVCETFPFLSRELEKERTSRNPYHTRMFEGVALGLACLRDLDSL
jgi:Holliday junction resolvasome RuvABC endonuclease subunit